MEREESKALPPRTYLDKHVMPTLLNGLQQLVRAVPRGMCGVVFVVGRGGGGTCAPPGAWALGPRARAPRSAGAGVR